MKITFEGTYQEIQLEVKNFICGAAATTPLPAEPVAEIEKKKPGPKAKAKEEPAPEAPAPAAVVPSDKDVQDALVAVNDKLGIDKAIECLSKFNVKRGRELTDVQKQPFMDLCKSLVG